MKQGILMFSGGVDSTYTVLKIAKDFDKLILLTYKTPGMINVNFSKRSYRQLKKIFGKKISNKIIDIGNFVYFLRGGILKCVQDNLKYKFYYSWCLGCKLAMHLYTISYCKKNNIKVVLDGSNAYDLHALEQHQDVKEAFHNIYQENGINFRSPFYHEKGIIERYDKKSIL
jgi:PP-loop superfamily ATP-utilizing enzyme